MTQFSQTTSLPPLVFMPAQSSKDPISSSSSSEPAVSSMRPPQTEGKPEDVDIEKKPHPVFSLPKLRFEIRDLKHPGAEAFLEAVIASKALATSVQSVLSLLYHSPDYPTTTVPPTRSVTLILRPMEGVAYTTGSDLDSDHKEIHFSLDYIHQVSPALRAKEILGVLTHEMVHCYQYNAFGTCPGGLIEGIADWVRLKADLSPPHWKQARSKKWDAGYQQTGYFLQYLESRFGPGTVRRMNEKLRIERYSEKGFWTGLLGGPVEQLWADYQKALTEGEGDGCADEDEGDIATISYESESEYAAIRAGLS